MALTALQIKHAKEGMHSDGGGLYLQVSKAGTKSWIFRYQIDGRRREMGLGGLADKSAIKARAEIPALRAQLAANSDPLELKRIAQADSQAEAEKADLHSTLFKTAALEYILKNRKGWSNAHHAWQWENSLGLYAFPTFGDRPAQLVSTEDILAALTPIWETKTETATRVRQRIESILDYARVRGYRSGDNPARWRGHLEHILPKPSSLKAVKHQPAVPYKSMGEFMEDVRLREGSGARALEFAILTASRSGEVRGAMWGEVNLVERVWVVPAERMKARRDHLVPLSGRAIEILEEIPRLAGQDLIFAGQKLDRPLSDRTLLAVIVRINKDRIAAGLPEWVDGKTNVPVVPHGCRSSFRDWAGDVTEYPNEMGELALAHSVGDKVEAAYRRGVMFEKRRRMMDDWAAWCDSKSTGVLVPLLANAA